VDESVIPAQPGDRKQVEFNFVIGRIRFIRERFMIEFSFLIAATSIQFLV
jgi:hypothetical protein